MALIIKDRVQETSTTSGTGTITLAGAVTGYQSFASAIGTGNTTYYGIYETQTNNWEVGVGTVGTGTLARTTVLASSNGGSLVNFGGGQLAVYGDYPAGKAVTTDTLAYPPSIGNTTPNSGAFTTLSSNGNISFSGNNVSISIQPTGTGVVYVNPATTGAIDNMTIGATTPKAITGTTVTATTFSGSGSGLTSIPNSALVNSSITINGSAISLGGSVNVGTITSVSGTTNQITASTTSGAVTLSLPSSVTTGQYIANQSTSGSSSQGAFAYGTLGYSDVNHILTMQASQNSYIQMEIQNTNTGASASSDVIVGNNNTTSTTYYGDFGMNSSGWTGTPGTNSFGAPNTVYVTATSGDLAIGTTTSNAIRFVVAGGADNATVSSAGVWTFANQITGSISGTASNVTGTVAIANGGTGQTTASAAFNALAPSQTGNSGKYLTTNGTTTSWASVTTGTVTSVSGTGTVNGITLSGTVTSSGSLTLGGAIDLTGVTINGGSF